jgi:hypothetical protein
MYHVVAVTPVMLAHPNLDPASNSRTVEGEPNDITNLRMLGENILLIHSLIYSVNY